MWPQLHHRIGMTPRYYSGMFESRNNAIDKNTIINNSYGLDFQKSNDDYWGVTKDIQEQHPGNLSNIKINRIEI